MSDGAHMIGGSLYIDSEGHMRERPATLPLEAWHAFLARNPLTAQMLDLLPPEQAQTIQSYWLAGYAQGRSERP